MPSNCLSSNIQIESVPAKLIKKLQSNTNINDFNIYNIVSSFLNSKLIFDKLFINKSGDKFVAEDDSGMGIDYFKFDEKELHFNYNTNGLEAPALFVQGETLSQVGKYKLKKC